MIHYNAAHLCSLQTFDDGGGGAEGDNDESPYFIEHLLSERPKHCNCIYHLIVVEIPFPVTDGEFRAE